MSTPPRVLAFLLALLLVAPALGQIAPGVIADPIDRDDLDRWAARLELSPQQRTALDEMHESYVAASRELRDGALARFLTEHPDFGNATTDVTADVEAQERTVRELRAVHTAQRGNDDRFLDRLAAILAEPQLERLPSIRAARARARHLGGPAQQSPHRALDVDVSDLYHEVAPALEPEVRALADEIVATYERGLARAAEDAHEFALEYGVWTARRLGAARAAAGTEEDERSDFATRAGVVREGQTARDARAGVVARLHRHLFDELRPLLDGSAGATFERRFLTALYPDVPADRGPAERELERIGALDDPPAALVAAVAEERAAYEDAIDRVRSRMMDTHDAWRLSNAAHSLKMMLDGEEYVYDDPARFERALRRLKGRLDRVNRDTIQRLQALVDEHAPGLVALRPMPAPKPVDPSAGKGLHSSVTISGGDAIYGYKHIPRTELERQFGADRWSLAPIGRRDLDRWLRAAGVGDEHEAVVDVLHEDYLARYAALDRIGPFAELRGERQDLFAIDEAGRPAIPDEETVRRLFRAERAAVEAMRGLDAALFEEIQVAVGDDLPESGRRRLERARSRALLVAAPPPPSHALFVFGDAKFDRSAEQAGVDVAALVVGLDLPATTRAAVEGELVAYEEAATDLFRTAFDLSRRLDEERALLMARHLRWDDEDGLVADDMRVDQAMTETSTALVSGLDDVLALNRRTREAIESALPGPAAAKFAAAYKRAAWPEVYRDGTAAADALESALGLDDLGDAQREAIAVLMNDYRSRYEAMSDAIIAAQGRWTEERSRLDERDDLNDRTRRRLRDILSAEQIRQVAGLAEDS